jgi:hypothetical protein
MKPSTKAYLDSVLARGTMLIASNPVASASSVNGLGDTVSVSQFLGGSDALTNLAADFSITLTAPPAGLSAVDRQAVLVTELMNWQTQAMAVVVRAEQAAGIPIGGDSATERIEATNRLEDQITGVVGKLSSYAGSVLPESIAPKVTKEDLARSLRRQYNSAEAGLLAHTPQGVALLLTAGNTEDDIQRDYLYRMTTYQAIVKLGEQQATAVSGLGFLFLAVPMIVFAMVAVITIIAAALICTRYLSQRNEIWGNVMKTCAEQATTSDFCKSAVEEFAAEPSWTILGVFKQIQPFLLVGGALYIFSKLRKK